MVIIFMADKTKKKLNKNVISAISKLPNIIFLSLSGRSTKKKPKANSQQVNNIHSRSRDISELYLKKHTQCPICIHIEHEHIFFMPVLLKQLENVANAENALLVLPLRFYHITAEKSSSTKS
jgi:hypothetical protein